jgi:phospholipase A2-like protein
MNDTSWRATAGRDREPRGTTRPTRRRLAALMTAGTLTLAVIPASSAEAVIAAQRTEQVRYAKETMLLGNRQFAERKADFVAAGCGTLDNVDKCQKPVPYNQFDWDTDGCSGPTPGSLRKLFYPACQQHDFGYRNYGKGLTLGRDENTRRWIDDRFRAEMKSICNYRFSDWTQYANLQACFKEADGMYAVVRNLSDWSRPLDQPVAQPAPAEPAEPAEPARFAETTGSVTHTWTNRQNAGGSPGPVISAGTTVQVTCRADGFQVTDGNTAWYRIASSPWNNTYWASADAFYNNGSASGTLRGTPHFDNHVPVC